jgi:hypothetical protein
VEVGGEREMPVQEGFKRGPEDGPGARVELIPQNLAKELDSAPREDPLGLGVEIVDPPLVAEQQDAVRKILDELRPSHPWAPK